MTNFPCKSRIKYIYVYIYIFFLALILYLFIVWWCLSAILFLTNLNLNCLLSFVLGYLTHLWVVTSNFVVLHNDNDVLEEESITF